MNIIESNMIIANFMGAKSHKEALLSMHGYEIWLPIHGIVNHTTIELGKGKTIHYHDKWDWLMPVVDKINKLPNLKKQGDTTLDSFKRDIRTYVGLVDIQNAYNHIIQLLNWYNPLKK